MYNKFFFISIFIIFIIILIIIIFFIFRFKNIFCKNIKNFIPQKKNLNLYNLSINNYKNNLKICLTYIQLLINFSCTKQKKYLNLLKNYKLIYYKKEPVALLTYNKNTILISWKGTIYLNDLFYDIQQKLVSLTDKNDNVKVHKGFKKYLENIIEKIIHTIDSILKVNKNINKIYSTGHSLGAAISTLSSLYYSSKYKNIKLYNYATAPPRVGNEEFTKLYNSKNIETFLFINLFDNVPNMPSLTKGYRHVNSLNKKGVLLFYGKKKNYIENHIPETYFQGIDKIKIVN